MAADAQQKGQENSRPEYAPGREWRVRNATVAGHTCSAPVAANGGEGEQRGPGRGTFRQKKWGPLGPTVLALAVNPSP